MTYQEMLLRDRYANAALSVVKNGRLLQQPKLSLCAKHLFLMNAKRMKEKGKEMSDDHLRQEAVMWAHD